MDGRDANNDPSKLTYSAKVPRCYNDIDQELETFLDKRYLTQRDIFQDLLDFIVDNTESEIGYLHLVDETAGQISLNVWSRDVYLGCTTSVESHYPVREAGVWADAIRLRSTVVHNDYPTHPNAKGLPEGHFSVYRHMSTPIFWGGMIVGIVGVGNKAGEYTEADASQLEHLTKIGWPIIQDRLKEFELRNKKASTQQANQQPEEVLISIIKTVSKALELRDEYTSHHQSNVSVISVGIAKELDLSEAQVFGLRIGALVHDIGKIAVPAEILGKTGRLNPAEIVMMQTHTTMGAQIFREAELPWPVKEIIEQHHERMDGSGYPYGLQGKEICLEARIVGVADTFDAMSTDRPYRHAPGFDRAIQTLKQERGRAFDAYVVDAFLAALNKKNIIPEELYGYHTYDHFQLAGE